MNILQKTLAIALLLLLKVNCFAQLSFSLDDDSLLIAQLRREAAETRSDSTKAYKYLQLSVIYQAMRDTVKMAECLRQGATLGRAYPFLRAVSAFYNVQSQLSKRDIPAIESALMQADTLLSKFTFKEAYKLRAKLWNIYGVFQAIQSKENNAMEAYTNKAQSFAQLSGNAFVIGYTNMSIAVALMNTAQRNKAKPYLLAAISALEGASDEDHNRLEKLVETYILTAENFVYAGNTDSAHIYLSKAKHILTPKPKSNLYLIYYFAEGSYFSELNQYGNAIASFDKGIALGGDAPIAQTFVNRLKYVKYLALLGKQDYKLAIATLAGLQQSASVGAREKKIYAKELARVYAVAGDSSEAYRWAVECMKLSDSLHEKNIEGKVLELERKYNEAENQKRIATLSSEKQGAIMKFKHNRLLAWLWGIVSLFLAAFAVLALLYYRSTKKLAVQKELSYQRHLKEVQQEQQLQLAKALLEGEEKERNRLAGDLHDGLGGMLASVKINLSGMATEAAGQSAELQGVIVQLDKASNELRRIARNMMPESLLNAGLESALREICESFLSAQCTIEFQAFDIGDDLPQDVQVTIFRIVQELVSNAVRHAEATHILVQCSQNQHRFYITVEDNGKGLDTRVSAKGIGFLNLMNRLEYLHGQMDIVSLPQEGTTINIELNVDKER
jgi:two-component system, NarL family, sensor kinase